MIERRSEDSRVGVERSRKRRKTGEMMSRSEKGDRVDVVFANFRCLCCDGSLDSDRHTRSRVYEMAPFDENILC